MSRFRRWSFTNYTLDTKYDGIDCKYLIVGREVCPTTGNVHHQCYIEFDEKKSFKQVKALLPTVHLEASKGGAEANQKYCSKDNNVIYEFGTPKQQGKRNDLSAVREVIEQTGKMREVVEVSNSYQATRMAEVILKYKETKRTWKPTVYWFYGPSGTGKTKKAFEMCKDPYVSSKSLKWWEGYDAHEEVIIDDFRADFCTFHELLRILDRYEYRIECKGGSRQLLAKTIIITCPLAPEYVYMKNTEEVRQLLRRIDFVQRF